MRKTSVSVLHKLGWNSAKKSQLQNTDDAEHQAKWLHHGKEIKDHFIAFNAKYLGCVEVNQPKGVEMVKDSIKKLKIARQLKKSEAGHKASKLVKVEIIISIDAIKVVEVKNKNMICARPLQRVSYCADDHKDKRLFAFIAKEQESKTHKCFVFVSEKEASEITLTLGQAFQLAYKRYLEKEKTEIKQNKDAINTDKQISILKQENTRLKLQLDLNKSKNEVHNVNGDTTSPVHSAATSPMRSTLPSESFGFMADAFPAPNDPSFEATFDPVNFNPTVANATECSGDLFNPVQQQDVANLNAFNAYTTENNNNSNNIDDMFIPQDKDFFCKQPDPFADTPDWSSVASEESNYKQLEGTQPTSNHEQSANPFALSLMDPPLSAIQDLDNSQNNSDKFLNYLSNVVAKRTDDSGLNGAINGSNDFSFVESNNNSISNNNNNNNSSLDANFSHFNTNSQFNASNEFGFNKLDLTDVSGNMISEFNETDDGFFPDNDFIPRPKAHTITVLTNQTRPPQFPFNSNNDLHIKKSNLTASGNAINEADESGFFPEDSFEESFRQKSKSFSPSSNQVVRPRPSSFCVQGQILPAPPTKSSLKKPTTCIKTPTLKVLSSTPAREEMRRTFSDDKPNSPSYILPNVKNTAPAIEVRSRTRSRGQQSATPLKESICRASKSLEDLCSIDSSQSSTKSSPKTRRATNPFASPSSP